MTMGLVSLILTSLTCALMFIGLLALKLPDFFRKFYEESFEVSTKQKEKEAK
jgi:hypothetical protein